MPRVGIFRRMAPGQRLSGDDVARLHMDRRDNPMAITAVVRLAAPLPFEALAARVRERLLPRPRFTDRVVDPALGAARWEPDVAFDLREHLHHLALPAPGDDAALATLVEDLAGAPLDPRVPLWHLHLVDGVGAGCALVFRVHHVVVDGVALVDVLLGLTDEGAGDWLPPSVRPPSGSGLLRALAPAVGLASLALSRPEPASPLTRPHLAHKRLAWSHPLALDALKGAGHARSVGVTAMLLATVTGALRAVLAARGPVDPGLAVRAMVPLSVRGEGEGGALGNRYASVFVALPVGAVLRGERVAAVRRALERAKVAGGLDGAKALVRVAGRVGSFVERLGVEHMSRRASLVVSNVPGPRGDRHIEGRRLDAVVAFAPVTGALGLGVTCVGYGGAVFVGVASGLDDASLPDELAAAIDREFEALTSTAPGPG